MKRKGVFFFVLDAFIAGVIIISSLIIVFSSFSKDIHPTEELFIAEDYMSLLSSTKIKDIDDDYVRQLIKNNNISQPYSSALNQIGLFFHEENINDARYLAQIFSVIVPKNKGLNMTINDQVIYTQSPSANTESVMLNSSRVIFIINKTNIIGPDIIEVDVWG